MISTKDLSGLPNAERLKNFCKGLAALDIIMAHRIFQPPSEATESPDPRL